MIAPWIVHVEGPDDVHHMESEVEARSLAADINGWVATEVDEEDPYMPMIWAKVYSADEWEAKRAAIRAEGPLS